MNKNIITSIALAVLFLISAAGVVEGATNIINNPGFESGKTSWLFFTSATGNTFTAVPPGYEGNNSAKLVLNNPGTNIQLYQTGVKLEPNTRYRLSFAAYSTSGHDVTVNLFKHVSPYTNYGLSNTFDLGTSWQVFNYEFTTKGFTNNVSDGRFQFWLASFAAAGDIYYIDAIILEKVSPPTSTIEERLAALEANMTALKTENTALKNLLAGVSRNGNDLYIDGANLHIRDGSGSTDGDVNGLGNLVIGYNELRNYGINNRTGSHNLVFGSWNNYGSYGGIVAGYGNQIMGPFASVSGGEWNTASGEYSSVSGGQSNTASGYQSSVSGGGNNKASGPGSSVSGGESNTASNYHSSVSGGAFNIASGYDSSVSGGGINNASGFVSSVSGGESNTASNYQSSVSGGYWNTASGNYSSVSGGLNRNATGIYDWWGGGSFQDQ